VIKQRKKGIFPGVKMHRKLFLDKNRKGS